MYKDIEYFDRELLKYHFIFQVMTALEYTKSGEIRQCVKFLMENFFHCYPKTFVSIILTVSVFIIIFVEFPLILLNSVNEHAIGETIDNNAANCYIRLMHINC